VKLKFLGTAAAEGVPAIFCSCQTCKSSGELGGRNIRKRSSLLLDDKIMFDFNDALTFVHLYQLDLSKLEHLVITHSHSDHFNIFDLEFKLRWYTNPGNPPLNIYANEKALSRFDLTPEFASWDKSKMELLQFHTVKRWQPFFIDQYKITPLAANHVTSYAGEETCIYVVEKDNKRFLYGLDSGFYPEETWEYLKSHYFHLMIFDSTLGLLDIKERTNHMSLAENVEVVEILRKSGSIDENSVLISTHFSHNGRVVYDLHEKTYKEHGLIMSYDGMEIVL